ncbi:hypothetical protein MMC20_002318 [Loxospora ochrophaea]|nr:hypothetical protein [Loxospora ochrophaea]
MSVGLPSRQIHDFLDELPPSPNPVVVACYNSPNNVTVSGDEKQIDVLKRNLDNVGAFARKLKVGVAYHSPQMDAVAEAYAESIKNIKSGGVKPSLTAMISTVTGQRISADDLRQPSYWVKNMVSPVRFSEAVEHICAQNVRKKLDGSHLSNLQIDVCLEVGPHSALRAPIRDITTSRERPMIYLSALNRPISALTSMLDTAGQLHCLGYPVNIRNINHNGVTKTKLVSLCDLPEYPFDHSKTYFHESRISKSLRLRKQPKLDLLGKTAADWNPLEAQWRNFIRVSELPWVEDHKASL